MNNFNRENKNTSYKGYTPKEIIPFLTDNIFSQPPWFYLQDQGCKSHFAFHPLHLWLCTVFGQFSQSAR